MHTLWWSLGIRFSNITEVKMKSTYVLTENVWWILTIPASWETSMKKARAAAQMPVTTVLLTGTCVVLWTSEKNDGSRPSRAMAINILGWRKYQSGSMNTNSSINWSCAMHMLVARTDKAENWWYISRLYASILQMLLILKPCPLGWWLIFSINLNHRRNLMIHWLRYAYTCGNIDPIKVEQRARTAPVVTRYLKQDKHMKTISVRRTPDHPWKKWEEVLTLPSASHVWQRQMK